MSADIIIRTSDLGKRYGSRWAVRNLNLEVRRGEIFGFLGPNGAGKSTTIRMLLSLVKPTAGGVELFGKPLDPHRSEILSRVGGLVEAADFYPYLSARKNLEAIGALRGGTRPGEVEQVLHTVGLFVRAEDKVKTFSHGMKQRLGLAQALLGDPELIILDEPTTGLDPQGIKEIRELMRWLTHERGMTIFLSSHLLGEVELTCTSMAILNQGQLVVQGEVKKLIESDDVDLRIDASPIELLHTTLEQEGFSVAVLNGLTRIRIQTSRIGALNTALVRAGITVKALVPQRSLEQYFLDLTESSQAE